MTPDNNHTPRFRILALDVDGTLLDPQGLIRPATLAAVSRAAKAGIQPVLCTGRRYRRARPIALSLGISVPLVCNSGALVKDPITHRTLMRADFDPPTINTILNVFEAADQPAVTFTDHDPSDHDFLVARFPTGRLAYDEYVRLNQVHAGLDPCWMTRARAGQGDFHFHLCAIGTRPEMETFEHGMLQALSGKVRTFVQRSPRYTGTMCEMIHPEASKWTAVLHLAQLWGVAPSLICAVGDDRNDIPMIQGAGLGVAMGHAPPEVLAVADHVTLDHESDGLSQFIDTVLLA